ncbi:hypothetical protein GASC598I20_001210 [Gilliamella apicola SCGC AB-598-I20]|nr:hypothetical protein GASC598I20_001210 [Gilliamella apicola SCGC AB-598-I20]
MRGKIFSISLVAMVWFAAISIANADEIDCPARINIKSDHPELAKNAQRQDVAQLVIENDT